MEPGLHRIVIVGGGAGGLELATRLGNKLGRRRKAAVTLIDGKRAHLWKPLLHEVAAGSMDMGLHEVDYLAQAFWHGFTYRAGEMTGIDRRRRVVEVAPFIDEEGRQVTPAREFGYDTLVDRHRQPDQRLRHAGREGARHRAGDGRSGSALPPPPGQRLHPRPYPDRAVAARAAAGRHHRRRGNGYGAGRRAAQDDAPARRLRARSHRSRHGHQDQPDRGRTAHLAAVARAAGQSGNQAARRAQGAHPHRCAGGGGAGERRQARQRDTHSGRAGRVGRRRQGAGYSGKTSLAWRPTASTSWWCATPCRPRATTTSSPSAIAPPAPGQDIPLRCRHVRRLRTSRPRIWRNSCRGACEASR